MFGKFNIQSFESEEKLFAYIGDENYGNASMPGVCFGFSIYENKHNDYEYELFFNDLWPTNLRSIPSQS